MSLRKCIRYRKIFHFFTTTQTDESVTQSSRDIGPNPTTRYANTRRTLEGRRLPRQSIDLPLPFPVPSALHSRRLSCRAVNAVNLSLSTSSALTEGN